ncbi:hypothetical protein AB4084_32750, partial [Lysobacter sp. 2RAB21]
MRRPATVTPSPYSPDAGWPAAITREWDAKAQRYESEAEYLARVRKAAARMGDLIDALLKMSRLTRSELKHESVDLSRFANELIEELRMGDSQRAVEVR